MDKPVPLSICIQDDVQGNFESFAKLYKYGHFGEARTWFDECFGASSWKESFPLAAELAKCYLEQGDFTALRTLTTKAKDLFRGSEGRLLQLLHALASLEDHKELDDFVSALDQAAKRAFNKSDDWEEQDRSGRPSERSDERLQTRTRETGLAAAEILDAEGEANSGNNVAVTDCGFEIRTQLMSTSLRIAQALKQRSVTIPPQLEHPPIDFSGSHTSEDGPWSVYRHHFAIALAKRDFASAQELLTPLLSLLDSIQGRQVFLEFAHAISTWSTEVKAYLGDDPSGKPTSGYIMAMESSWLAMANATTHYCKHLSTEVDNHTSTFPFGRRRKIKEIWTWLHQLRQVLMHLELCDASVVDSRPGLLYQLQVLDTKRLEGQQHAQPDIDNISSSASQQGDVLLEKIIQDQRKDTPSSPPSRSISIHSFLDLLLQLITPSSYSGVRWTLSTALELGWQICLTVLLLTFLVALIGLILFFPGWTAILVSGLGVPTLARLASYHQGPTTSASESHYNRWDRARWVFLAGTFTTPSLFQADLNMISSIFGRRVYGIRGQSRGWLVDFLFDYASERLGISSHRAELTYEYLRKVSTNPDVERIVLIAHGAGAVAASHALNKLFLQVPLDYCCKIEVYTFGSMARAMNNPAFSPTSRFARQIGSEADPERRVLATIEHYCDKNDPLARMGVLEGLEQSRDQLQGVVFEYATRNGHLFLQRLLNSLGEMERSASVVYSSAWWAVHKHDLPDKRPGVAGSPRPRLPQYLNRGFPSVRGASFRGTFRSRAFSS